MYSDSLETQKMEKDPDTKKLKLQFWYGKKGCTLQLSVQINSVIVLIRKVKKGWEKMVMLKVEENRKEPLLLLY